MEPTHQKLDMNSLGLLWRGTVSTIRQNLLQIVVAAILGVCSAIALSCVISLKYTATANVFPTPNPGIGSGSSSLDLSSIAGGMLSSATGLGGGQQAGFARFKSLLTSPATAAVLFNDNRIKRNIFKLDPENGAPPPSMTAIARRAIKKAMFNLWGLPLTAGGPSAVELGKIIKRRVSITADSRSNSLAVQYANEDPDFAKYFLTRLITVSDDLLRKQALQQSTQYIHFLNSHIQDVPNRENSEALIRVLTKYQENFILTSVNTSYAAQIVGGILVPETPDDPSPALLLILATIGFFILWLILFVLVGFFKKADFVLALRQSGIMAL